ncbi:hypothetical protein ART_1583 [Arthrobacter sp. PAMC 25486]|uniref:hypothetical protein n=1 Tax=Arthrobacter sp. PAMC 25486 TaxID=1494608 RepID=UPI0005361ADB|nr:hypothetical protein [Arthrobacter sp. PAMC 25486]AIY01182.1 hypothetical protein ART_1583 [Arthrobacter sp. PAMC 25486]
MDISETLAAKSDQQNYDDYLLGPRTVTITAVHVPGGDQPVHIELAEYPGRPYKPNKSMRRVLAKAWGPESGVWVGRGLTLFGNSKVSYGGKAVGGIEIAAMSHIDKPLSLPLTSKRGQKAVFTVQPLAMPTQRDWQQEISMAPDTDTLNRLWTEAPAQYQDAMKARAAQLKEAQ